MRYRLVLLCMLLGAVPSAFGQLSISIGVPGMSIGINLPLYPDLVRVPGYPVYYAPQLNSNYFFYDGMYWAYERDSWYASSWYNGPWGLVDREVVPYYVLRVPVRYYRSPPEYFRGWRPDAPPRWGEHWGRDWEQHRRGWDKWDRRSVPAAAPLPVYQRQYTGDRYPQVERQRELFNQNYRYQPRDAVVKRHFQEQAARPTVPAERKTPREAPRETQREQQREPQGEQRREPQGAAQDKGSTQREAQRPRTPEPQQPATQRPAPVAQEPRQAQPGNQRANPPSSPQETTRPQQGAAPRERQAPGSGADKSGQTRPADEAGSQGKGSSQDSRRGQKQQDKDREKD